MNSKENIKDNSQGSSPVISIIIPFYGEKDDLFGCLKGLKKQNFHNPFEIIVVESGIDNGIEQLTDKVKNIVLISSHSLLYPGKARNLCVKNSKTDLLAFIDADCIPVSTWLYEVYSSLKNGDEMVIGPVINLYPFHPIASVDNLIQFADFQKHRTSENVDHFPGCNLGIKKEIFIKSGGFPEEINIGEDSKLSETLTKRYEARISFNQRMVVKHSGRKKIFGFLKHHVSFGYYRGYSKQGISSVQNKFRSSLLYSVLFGLRRLIIICIRTLQWNQVGIVRIIFYFPFLILGLSAWVFGFWKGNQEVLKGKS